MTRFCSYLLATAIVGGAVYCLIFHGLVLIGGLVLLALWIIIIMVARVIEELLK